MRLMRVRCSAALLAKQLETGNSAYRPVCPLVGAEVLDAYFEQFCETVTFVVRHGSFEDLGPAPRLEEIPFWEPKFRRVFETADGGVVDASA